MRVITRAKMHTNSIMEDASDIVHKCMYIHRCRPLAGVRIQIIFRVIVYHNVCVYIYMCMPHARTHIKHKMICKFQTKMQQNGAKKLLNTRTFCSVSGDHMAWQSAPATCARERAVTIINAIRTATRKQNLKQDSKQNKFIRPRTT